jgi:hypothetical protein
MNFPLHFFRLYPAVNGRPAESVEIVRRADVHGDKPLFRAPALPTPNQLCNELPFTAKLRPRLRERT